MRPVLLEDGDEDEVELVEQGPLFLHCLFGTRNLEDELDDEVANTL